MEIGYKTLAEQMNLGYMFKGLQISPKETPIQKLRRKIPGFDQRPSFTDTPPEYRSLKPSIYGNYQNLPYEPEYDKPDLINPVLRKPNGLKRSGAFELMDALKRARYTGQEI